MENKYYPLEWEPVNENLLELPKVKELIGLLYTTTFPYAKLLTCYKKADQELLVLDIEPEVPQYPVYDIRIVERILVSFQASDSDHPRVFALRKDFPLVPHLNFNIKGEPPALCLYQTKYEDLKYKWTAAEFLQQLHNWLNKTARGELHELDQPLEQVFFASSERIILPSILFSSTVVSFSEDIVVRALSTTLGESTWIASLPDQAPPETEASQLSFSTFVYTVQPEVHSVIHQQPRTLLELQSLFSSGQSITEALRCQLDIWKERVPNSLDNRLLFLLRIPKQRYVEGPIEAMDLYAFASHNKIADIGIDLGIWTFFDSRILSLYQIDEKYKGESTKIYPLNPIQALTQKRAALYNGLEASETNYVAVGIGSLGSQVINNLARAGQGKWTLIDEDQLLPHNVARHYLPGLMVGYGKAKSLARVLKSAFEDANFKGIEANVLKPSNEQLLDVYAKADVLLDMSASVAVSRELCLGIQSSARRISLFLNPSGTDLIMLAESHNRSHKLDELEMEYYHCLYNQIEMSNHLTFFGNPIRFSHACRDVSVQLSQEQVALHAAIGSRAVRTTINNVANALVKIWKAADDLSVSTIEISPSIYIYLQAGSWTLSIAVRLLESIDQQRQKRLPYETGGVILGTFDTQRRIVYIVDHISSPPDSIEWPTAYFRGIEGLSEKLNHISDCTANHIMYVGEWHSHPNQFSTRPSNDDRKLFDWLKNLRSRDGLPAVMAIAGQDGASSWYVDDIETSYADCSLTSFII